LLGYFGLKTVEGEENPDRMSNLEDKFLNKKFWFFYEISTSATSVSE
tara:strand:- start:252 stop:392 length:141 start_codon:yes stop_codon:yes gene_type:complete